MDKDLTGEANIPASLSPLYEADPKSLSLLFDRIDQKLVKNLPLEITDLEIEDIVDYYIKDRKRFVHDQINFIKPTRAKSLNTKKTLSQAINAAQMVEGF